MNVMNGTCAKCKRPIAFSVDDMEIFNGEKISGAILSHPDLEECTHCGQKYEVTIQSIQGAAIAFIPLKDNNRVTPAGPSDVARIIRS